MTDRDEILRLAEVAEERAAHCEYRVNATHRTRGTTYSMRMTRQAADLRAIATLLRELAETRGKEQA